MSLLAAHIQGMNQTTTPLIERLARALAVSTIPVLREPRIREAIPAHREPAAVIAAAIEHDAELRELLLSIIPTRELHQVFVARLALEHPLPTQDDYALVP